MDSVDYKKTAAAWAYAGGKPNLSGLLRVQLEDFIVTEKLSFEPSGQGEHVYLYLEKRGINTVDLVQQLAKFSRIPISRIAYAGLKDKQAHTTQWFSVYISGFVEPDWYKFESEQIKIHKITRHNKKLKRGAIRYNHFVIRLRSVQGDIEQATQRLQEIKLRGVPNYFGEQRFGIDFQNLNRVQLLATGKSRVKNRQKRGMLYSSARSFLFNQILSKRIQEQNWDSAVEGDVMSLDGSRSHFKMEQITAEILERVERNDIHPSGPLVGVGKSETTHLALTLENQCLNQFSQWQEWLVSERVAASRRSLRLIPQSMVWEWSRENYLSLDFSLPSGSYATAVLREVITYK